MGLEGIFMRWIMGDEIILKILVLAIKKVLRYYEFP